MCRQTAVHVTGTVHCLASTAANITVPFYCLSSYGCRRQAQAPPFIKVKVKVALEQATNIQRESRGIALLFLKPRHWMWVGGQHHPPAALPPGRTRYPLYRVLGGPQGRSGRGRKISLPPGFDPRTFQSVASRYTDWAIAARLQFWQFPQIQEHSPHLRRSWRRRRGAARWGRLLRVPCGRTETSGATWWPRGSTVWRRGRYCP